MDLEYLFFLQQIRESLGSVSVDFFQFITDVSHIYMLPILCFVYWCFRKEDGTYAFWTVGLVGVLNSLVKMIACVYRPWIKNPAITPPALAKAGATGYSFPSGHTSNATSWLGMLGIRNFRQKMVFLGAFFLIALIALSRNFLGVHTPQDVCVGFLIGMTGIGLTFFLLGWEKKGPNRDLILLAGAVVAVVGFLLYISFKNYPLDYDSEGKLLVDPVKMTPDSWKNSGVLLGVVLGWVLEKRFLNFTIPSSWLVRIARFLPGMVVVFLLMKPFRSVLLGFGGPQWGNLAAFFLLVFWVMFLYPLIFTAIGKGLMPSKVEGTH